MKSNTNKTIAACLILLFIVGILEHLSWFFYIGLVVASILFLQQQRHIKDRSKEACFKAFLDNNYVGLVIFIGFILTYL